MEGRSSTDRGDSESSPNPLKRAEAIEVLAKVVDGSVASVATDGIEMSNDSVEVDLKKARALKVEEEEFDEREVVIMAFGTKESWFLGFDDASFASDMIPQSLSQKIQARNVALPPVKICAIASDDNWLIIFADYSLATSGFNFDVSLEAALMNCDSAIVIFSFAPAGGWFLAREDGGMEWERLPTSLNELLRRRLKGDPAVTQIAISGFGGWFCRFSDGECEFDSIPSALQKLLIKQIRYASPNLIVSLSPSDGVSYFVSIGTTIEWVNESTTLRKALEFSQTGKAPESITWIQGLGSLRSIS